MPRTWHDRHAVNKIEDDEDRDFYRSIVADKKPYFMRYIYPSLMKQYKKYIKNTNKTAMREFKITAEELVRMPEAELTERQKEFLRYYRCQMPVGTGNCVMNKICRRFEDEFDSHLTRHNGNADFDYRFMRSDAMYSNSHYNEIKKIYTEYNKRLQSYMVFASYERVDKSEIKTKIILMNNSFREECDKICPNRDSLCNLLLDLCYTRSATKQFVWGLCGEEIIHNLLSKNNNIISFPVFSGDGEIEYNGNRFTIQQKQTEVD